MQWSEVCADVRLQNLPYKMELNEFGQLLMTPVKVNHSLFQGRIIGLLYRLLSEGEALAECAIRTEKGTKVADVAWASQAVLATIQGEVECSIAPEICIEVISAGNSSAEMEEKKVLYFAAGAKEVWLCDGQGAMQFYASSGQLKASQWVPEFPVQI